MTANNQYYGDDNPDVLRYRRLHFQLEQLTDHLAEIIGFSCARDIIDYAVKILSENGEPIGVCDSADIYGKYRNHSAKKATMLSIIDSLILSGFNDDVIQSLYAKVPVSGLKWINSRLGVYRRNLAENF